MTVATLRPVAPSSPATRRLVYVGKRPVGFVETTRGGFFRALCYAKGLGAGPFTRAEFAENFARGENEPCNPFCRIVDRPAA